jgi:ketosteroid isomerase-like protein
VANGVAMGQALDTMQRWFAKPDAALYADDIDWYVPGYPVPHERYRGRGAVTDEFFPAMRAHFSAWKAEASEFIEAGDRVTVIGRYVGTTTAGTPVVIPFLHVWTVRDGKIAAVIAAADTAQFVRALG